MFSSRRSREFSKWCPSLRTVSLIGSKAERENTIKMQMIPGEFDVVITTNEACLREIGPIKKLKWKYVIIDEVSSALDFVKYIIYIQLTLTFTKSERHKKAHRIKNENSALAKLVRLIRTDFKLLLTGTPLQVSHTQQPFDQSRDERGGRRLWSKS